MKLGVLQMCPEFGNVKGNLERVESLLPQEKVDILVLPELFNTGYAFTSKEEAFELAEPLNGPTVERMRSWACDIGGVVIGGIAERTSLGVYNSAVCVDGNGVVALYRKAHLFYYEKDWFLPGDLGFMPFEVKGVLVGMLVCFDWIFPEAMRTLALKGASVIAHCANLVLPFCQDAMITRSIENRVFIITANRIGREKRGEFDFTFTGGSQIVAPGGRLLFRMDREEEGCKVVDVDPHRAENKAINERNDLWQDRRQDLYEI